MTDINSMHRELIAAHHGVDAAEEALERSIEKRCLAFGLAAEHGMTSGDIARLTGATPQQVLYAMRRGRGMIVQRRRRRHLEAA